MTAIQLAREILCMIDDGLIKADEKINILAFNGSGKPLKAPIYELELTDDGPLLVTDETP